MQTRPWSTVVLQSVGVIYVLLASATLAKAQGNLDVLKPGASYYWVIKAVWTELECEV